MAVPLLSLQVSPSLSEVARVNDELEVVWNLLGLPEDDKIDVLIATEEILTNIIVHAHADEIRMYATLNDAEFEIRVEDNGPVFNPVDYPAPELGIPLHRRPVGGLGIHIVRTLMNRMEYERRGDRNTLTIAKALEPKTESGEHAAAQKPPL